jgi:Na+(H+)/acetate symporter ActP
VGAVITLNVALGGMKGITLVQAFQYWAKMFAISVPIFVLMAVYGHYGKQIEIQKLPQLEPETVTKIESGRFIGGTAINGFILLERHRTAFPPQLGFQFVQALNTTLPIEARTNYSIPRKYFYSLSLFSAAIYYSEAVGRSLWIHTNLNVDAELGPFEVKTRDSRSDDEKLEAFLNDHGYIIQRHPTFGLRLVNQEFSNQVAVPDKAVLSQQQLVDRKGLPNKAPHDYNWVSPFGPLTSKAAAKAGLRPEEQRAYALLYTYSLIIALVCGTAGLPHILVRFYTNPNGVAAKRTTMWVMILIGVFYLFPPIFGVMGRNLLPELYSGVGAKGTDKIVLELPRILNENGSATVPVAPSGVSPDSPRAERVSAKTPKPAGETPALPEKKRIPWGSILSGITCAGAFAAFMSTFSGLLVSMTGALAHDVYGRMLRPKSTPAERMRMFKWCAVIVGGIAILLGSRVEKLEINFMVGQAFAIAAASYFPLLFMSVWWRKLTMKGAAAGTLTGGLLALLGISLTSFTTLGLLKWDGFWAVHPLLRILCEQPAIWAVPLAITLMVVVSKLTAKEIPADIRMKMLVLHAPEKLGLKQEYIQEHQHGH